MLPLFNCNVLHNFFIGNNSFTGFNLHKFDQNFSFLLKNCHEHQKSRFFIWKLKYFRNVSLTRCSWCYVTFGGDEWCWVAMGCDEWCWVMSGCDEWCWMEIEIDHVRSGRKRTAYVYFSVQVHALAELTRYRNLRYHSTQISCGDSATFWN